MSFLDNVKTLFLGIEQKEVIQKQDEEVGRIIAPVFREIPPQSKTGKFLTEGFRSWSFIAISAIADEICTIPLELYRRSQEGWVEIEKHPILNLLRKPNGFQTKSDFLWLASIYWLAEGEAPIYINNAKNPTEMVLLNPDRLTIQFETKDIIGGYKYRQSNGVETKIDAGNIIMLKMPSLISPFRGTGVLRYIAQTLDIDNFIEEYLKLFFFNDTTPGAVLETEQELNQTIIQRLKTQFQNRHQGVRNSHKLSILEKGLKYHKISSNVNELQLKELNDLIRDKVLAAFKVPKSILGIVEDVNRASAETSAYTFAKRAVLPRLRMIEEQLNVFLVPKFSQTEQLVLEFENPVTDDELQKAQINALAIQNGWMTVDEVRAEYGLDALGAGAGNGDDGDDEDGVKEYKEKRIREKKRPDALVDIMKDFIKGEEMQPKKFYTEEETVQFHNDKIMFITPLETQLSEDLKRNFRRQKRLLLKQIEGKGTKSNSINLQLDLDSEALRLIKIVSPALFEAISKESTLTYALLGLQGTLTPVNDLVKVFVDKRTVKLGKEATQTTQDAIDTLVKNWAEKEGSWTDLRKNIEEYFDGEGETGAKWRADMIARTELSNATGFAQQEVYKETGAIGKQWLTASDERVCPWCDGMNDKYGNGMIVDISENFFDKGDTLPDGSKNTWEAVDTPPLHPNCRCDIIPIYAESKMNKEDMRSQFTKNKVALEKEQLLKRKEEEIQNRENELDANIEEFEKMKEL